MNPRLVVAGTIALGMAAVTVVGIGINKAVKHYRKDTSTTLDTASASEPVLPEEEPVKADDALEQGDKVVQFNEEDEAHNQQDVHHTD